MSGFTAKFWTFWRHVVDLFFTITWTVLTSISIERKANCTCTIMSFTWSVLVWDIALDQSVHEKSFSYCKNFFFNKLSIIFTLLLQYYYNSATGQFLYWNTETQRYIPVAADGWVKLCLAMLISRFQIHSSKLSSMPQVSEVQLKEIISQQAIVCLFSFLFWAT